MIKTREKLLAKKLRLEGYSLNEISNKLKISKSTASVWLKDVQMSTGAKKRLAARTHANSMAGLRNYSEMIKENKKLSILSDSLKGKNKLNALSERDIYCIGLGLYWGEGYKTGNQEFGFTNSDPKMIAFYLKWLEVVFNVKKEDLIFRVSINELHKKREKIVENFWSKVTGVPQSQFTKMSFIKSTSKKMYSNSDIHFGTLRVKVRCGTRLRREVLGALQGIVV